MLSRRVALLPFRLCIEARTSAWFVGFHLSLRKNVISPGVNWFVSFSITAKPKSEKGVMPVSSKEDVLPLGCVISICCILALVSTLDLSVS